MKFKNILYLLPMLLALLLPAGCSDDNDNFVLQTSNENKVRFNIGVTLSGALQNETRAFGDEGLGSGGYYEFSDLYVAVFVEINGVSYLEEFVKADNTAPTWNETEQCWDFGVTLTKTDDARRLHLIANYPGLTMGFGEEGQLIGRMLANGDNHDVYWSYRDLERIDEGFETQLRKVPLLRNYAKIMLKDNRTNKSSFKIDGYSLYNVPQKGTVAPYNPSLPDKFANFVTADGKCQTYSYILDTEKYEGNEPFDDGTLLSTNINWKTIDEPTYIYERSNRTASNPTCMIIKGQYNSDGNITDDTPYTYYKLDFVYDDADSDSKVYYNLLRNFIFTMNINSVMGPGYDSVEEAIKQPASNNIGGDAVAEDYTNISDGTGRLFVSTTYMLLTNNNKVYIYYKYIPDIVAGSVNNNAVTVTAPIGNVLKEVATVAATDETSGHYAGWRRVTLTPKDVTTVSQSQELIFAANNLQRKIELVLRQPYMLSVDVPDVVDMVEKAPLDVKITLPGGIPASIFPLRLFISSEKNTIFPDYGSNLPAEAQNGKYGFIKEINEYEYEESADKVFVSTFLTNCYINATTVYVDNIYFNTGSDAFRNILTNLKITESHSVSYTLYNNRNPYKIYNNGYEDVTVTLRGVSKTIQTDVDNVISGTEFAFGDEIGLDEVLTFTFSDRYYRGYLWSNTTYRATCTVRDILEGTTINFAR